MTSSIIVFLTYYKSKKNLNAKFHFIRTYFSFSEIKVRLTIKVRPTIKVRLTIKESGQLENVCIF